VQPSARLVFKPAENQTVWAAVSRAVRTPSEGEGKAFANFSLGAPTAGPGGGLYVPTFVGNTELDSENLLAYELGYRIQPSHHVSVDVAAYYNDYSDLVGRRPTRFVPGTPVGSLSIQPFNTLTAESYGGETVLTVAPSDSWRLSAGYSLLMLQAHGDPDSDAEALERNAPLQQFVLRSSYNFSQHFSFDAQLRYVDRIHDVPSYLTADIRLTYRPTDRWELSIVGQNLLEAQHPEQASTLGHPSVEVPRGVYGRISWRF